MALHEQDRFGKLVPVNFLSRITYSWINKTLQRGNRSQLQEKDLLELSDSDATETLVEVLENAWTREVHLQGANPDKNHSVLLRALFKVIANMRKCLVVFLYNFVSRFANSTISVMIYPVYSGNGCGNVRALNLHFNNCCSNIKNIMYKV